MKYKRLGLPKKFENRLTQLIENETIYRELLKYFNPIKIENELAGLDEKIAVLVKKKNEIIETRKNPSTQKIVELERTLKANKKEQFTIITQYGALAKLAKIVKKVKETEVLMGV